MFCEIAEGKREGHTVFEDDLSVAFLDYRPLFPGHVLLAPKAHYETLADLPRRLIDPFFANAQLLAHAVEQALSAQGTFLGINNRVSQSVPHLHVHIVPRNTGDGLKGFFWPRRAYSGPEELASTRAAIQRVVRALRERSVASPRGIASRAGDSR